MNKKGFTLIELLVVIALLGLIIGIAVPGISKASKNAKKKTMLTKIKNIEKTAVLYSYDVHDDTSYNGDYNNEGFLEHDSTGYCNGATDCFYFYKDKISDPKVLISVNDLIVTGYLKPDEKDADGNSIIIDPTGTNNDLNSCKIQVYKKYKKVYAVLQYDNNNCKKGSQ